MKSITGNRLKDGAVVYRTESGGWTTAIANAAIYGGEADSALAAAQVDVANAIVVGLELIDVVKGTSGAEPVSLREKIRAYGPTVRSSSSATAR